MATPENESLDLLTAFTIGAMIGVGATLLLRSDPETPTERVLKRFRPIAKEAGKATRQARKRYGKSLRMGRAATEKLGQSTKDVIEDFRDQIEDILASARNELSVSARRQVKSARKALRRVRR
jgi:gas vesicle protein